MAHEGTFFSAFLLGPRSQAERRLERFHIMLTRRALSAEWEKSSGSFSGGLLYAGGKFPFFVFGAAFGERTTSSEGCMGKKTYGFRIARASAKSSLGVAAALRMCVAVSR